MKRFAIRNYGPTRQVPFKDRQILIVHDGCIETDDADEAAVLREQEQMYVTDNGVALVPPADEDKTLLIAPEIPGTPDDEIAYNDMTVPELKLLAKDRELSVKGLKKAGIIEALRAYDAEPDKPEESEDNPEPETDVEGEGENPEETE